MTEDRKNNRPKPVVLIILDGWGVAPPSAGNAIGQAKTPYINKLIKAYPAMTLHASGEEVGLSWGEIGNSEVGHMNLGAGKLIYQNLSRINRSISDGSFFTNEAFLKALKHAQENKSSIHLMGLTSSGNVHSSAEHLYSLLELCARNKFKNVFIHVFLDGRDMPYNSGLDFIQKLEQKINESKVGKIASISGRFYAMDRDNHWDRIQAAYQAMVLGEAKEKFNNAATAVQSSYNNKIYDEEFVPVVIIDDQNRPIKTIRDNDSIIFFNFRSDRAREITKAIILPGFEKFPRRYLENIYFVAMTEYEKDLPMEIAFAPEAISEPLAKILADNGLKQLHAAETEKYAHVTFFFNGGRETPFENEERLLIPSPRISAYDKQPEMSARILTKKVSEAIMSDRYDFIVINFSNCDMVAHTGNIKATIKACEIVDDCLKRLMEIILAKDGLAIITADHGNAEEIINPQSNEIDKEHSTYPVPFMIVGKQWEGKTGGVKEIPNSDLSLVQPSGILADVAPTILKIMNLPTPEDMTGKSLI